MDRGTELYQSYISGDEKALDELIEMYRSSLTSFIYSIVKENDTAESIMIDVFVELIRHKKFKGKSSLKTYLFSVARHKALHHIKRRKGEISLEEAEDYLTGGNHTEEDFISEERRRFIHEAVDSLNPTYREVIYLIYFEDMSYEDAALVLHKNKKQIANIAYRAKQALKEYFLEKDELL